MQIRSQSGQGVTVQGAQRIIERKEKQEQDLRLDGHETHPDSDEASSRGERTISYVPKPSYQSDRNSEIESLRK